MQISGSLRNGLFEAANLTSTIIGASKNETVDFDDHNKLPLSVFAIPLLAIIAILLAIECCK
jgi:hypothetical protein